MTDEAYLRELVLEHARRVRRLWFIGACATFVIGLVFTAFALWAHFKMPEQDQYEYDYHDRGTLIEDIQAGVAVGIGFTAALAAMGILSFWITRRQVQTATVVEAHAGEAAMNALISATVSPVLLLGRIAPVRVLSFTFKHDDKEIRMPAYLFSDEVPCGKEQGECKALKFSLFGQPAARLVCERGSNVQH